MTLLVHNHSKQGEQKKSTITISLLFHKPNFQGMELKRVSLNIKSCLISALSIVLLCGKQSLIMEKEIDKRDKVRLVDPNLLNDNPDTIITLIKFLVFFVERLELKTLRLSIHTLFYHLPSPFFRYRLAYNFAFTQVYFQMKQQIDS